MNCLIVDDNALARITLRQLITNIENVDIIGECDSATSAYNFLKTNKADLILLDVEMPEMTGIELTKTLVDKPVIIFTTSQKKYAVEAFELNVADYLIKPFTLPRLMQAIEKAALILSNKNTEVVDTVSAEILFIKENKAIKKIKWDDIFYIEAMGDYVKIKTTGKIHIVHTTMKQFEEKLDTSIFVRVHRSYIISIRKIESIQEGTITINETSIPLADTYKSILLKKLKVG